MLELERKLMAASQRIKLICEKNQLTHDERMALAVDPYMELSDSERFVRVAEAEMMARLSRMRISSLKDKTRKKISANLGTILAGEKVLLLSDLAVALRERMQDSPDAFRLSESTMKQLEILEAALKDGTAEEFAVKVSDESIKEIFYSLCCYDTITNLYQANDCTAEGLLVDVKFDDEIHTDELSELATAFLLQMKENDRNLARLTPQALSDLANLALESHRITAEGVKNHWSWSVIESVLLDLFGVAFRIVLAMIAAETPGCTIVVILMSFAAVSEAVSAIREIYYATFPAGVFETKAGTHVRAAANAIRKQLQALMAGILDTISSIIANLCGIFTADSESVREQNTEHQSLSASQQVVFAHA